jgi:phosphoribosyl-dephospho-CoA transferase
VGRCHGKIYVDEKIDHKDEKAEVEQATLERHARRLLAVEFDVPGSVWAGPNSERMDLV